MSRQRLQRNGQGVPTEFGPDYVSEVICRYSPYQILGESFLLKILKLKSIYLMYHIEIPSVMLRLLVMQDRLFTRSDKMEKQ